MTTRDLLKRTPFRLAAAFTTLFLITAVIFSAFLYVRLGAELASQIRNRVEETSDALVAIDLTKGYDELASVIESESASIRDDDTIFQLVDKAGTFRAGNVRALPVKDGWVSLTRESLVFVSERGQPDDQFVAKWRTVSAGSLLVGASDQEIRRTRHLLLRGLLSAMAATLGLAALFGALLARRAQNRINVISNTLLSVSQGRLDARVPMSGSSDDIDHVGEQINRTLGHLEMLVDKVNQASSDIAHDLKKPIGRLQQNLDQARRTAKTPSEFQSAIETALRDLDSIVDTFEALLNITQIEAGARKARFREVDLSQIISDMKEVYEAVAEDSGDALLTDSEIEGPALVRGDKELLTQLLANLIENAICHCPRQTRINVGLALTDSGYSIRVADNGPGIPASERCNVLRRLYRLERARSTPGNGLGLSLVLAIAELHDATLALEDNAPGL